MRRPVLAILGLALLAVLAIGDSSPSGAALPVTFHCAPGPSCPAITVAGDPYATLGGNPAPFRGYGDPDLEYDPASGILWLAYSWLDVLVNDPGPPPVVDFGVRTHLARSDDAGTTWTYETALNATTLISHPDTGGPGWTIHEVSNILREGPSDWQAIWLTYFDPPGETGGPEDRRDFYYRRALAPAPEGLGSSTAWARGSGTSPSFGAAHNLSLLPQLSDCTVFTEPALFSHGGATYLATNCVVFSDGVRVESAERLVLLREETVGYSYVGTLLTYPDAQDLGATRIEQADIAYTRDGAIILLATPILTGGTPEHLGCVAFEITSIASAQVLRDGSGNAVQLARITGDDSTVGPGACTYDSAANTGVLMHMHNFTASPLDMEFSVHATGVHPAGTSAGSAVRFYGTGAGDTDRIKLRIDSPPNSADVGADDFTVEFWMKADLADNPSGSCDDWICGNIIFDRDVFGGGARDWGISMRNGRIYFGTGLDEHVLRGDQNVADGVWHHVALTRARLPNGTKCLYIDGVLDVPCENGTTGDISYPDGYLGSWPNDPFLVVGAEKHDFDNVEYPSFDGTLDEIRIWTSARTQAELQANKNTTLSGAETGLVVYWRLDDSSGTVAADSSGEENHGEVKTGTPGAAEWVMSTAPLNGDGDSDGDGWSDAGETAIGTAPSDACGFTPGGDPSSETWPPDLVESNSINVSDVLALKPRFGTAVPPTSARYDLKPSGSINVSDVLALKPHFGNSCTP